MRKTVVLLVLCALVSCNKRAAVSSQTVHSVTVSKATFASMKSTVKTAALKYPSATEQVAAVPLALTASDGTGLRLVSYDARVVIEGPLAFTELHLVFENPQDRVIEGRFTIALAPGAAVSRLAMLLPTGWQEAEVVERRLARRAYEDFLHRKQDPALLEKKAGNEFSARIFPIAARSKKEIKLSYSQELVGSDAYRLPLKGLPKIDHINVSAAVIKKNSQQGAPQYRRSSLEENGFVPTKDFEVGTDSGVKALRNGDLVLLRVKPQVKASQTAVDSMIILFDTSASRAPGFTEQVKRLGQLVADLRSLHGDSLQLSVAAYDQVVAPLFVGDAGQFTKSVLDALLSRRPLGASNLHAALTWAADQKNFSRVLVITDGVVTAGPDQDDKTGDQLTTLVKSMSARINRLDVVVVGGVRDEARMRQLARGLLKEDGVVLDGALPVARLAERVSQETVSGIKVAAKGAGWVWPETIDGVQPGDEVLVYAWYPERSIPKSGASASVTLSGPINQTVDMVPTEVARPLLERASMAAQIARLTHLRSRLEANDEQERKKMKDQIVALSTEHRVLSDFTALLVLETGADYVRYGIKRNGLADILTVGTSGVTVLQRKSLEVAAPPVSTGKGRAPGRPPGGRDQPTDGVEDVAGRPNTRVTSEMSSSVDDRAVVGGLDTGVHDLEAGNKTLMPAPRKRSRSRELQRNPRTPRGAREPAFETFRGGGGRAARPPRTVELPPAEEVEAVRDERDRTTDSTRHQGILGSLDRGGQAFERVVNGNSDKKPSAPSPITGKLAEISGLIAQQQVDAAIVEALRWRSESPGDVLALVALGEALEAGGHNELAARAYGSIIDLFPSRADMLRFAGERLERLKTNGVTLAHDAYARAVSQRPDHLHGHRLLAMALLRDGRHDQALTAIEFGLARDYPSGRFAGGKRILLEDAGLIAAAWLAKDRSQRKGIDQRLEKLGATVADQPSLRFVLNWETDANDVDFHIHDGKGGHAYYSDRHLPSGGNLYEDVTTGYGPECFTINGRPTAYPYRVRLHYYSRGPMGYGMGKLEIIEHDGKGTLRFEQRPFIVMTDGAYVELGEITGSLAKRSH